MARVAGHLSVDDLEAGFRSARDPTAVRHFQVIWLLARGHTIADVAAVTSFVPRWVEQLLARYNAKGPDGLGDLRRRSGGVPSVLRPALLEGLPCTLDPTAARWGPVVKPQSGGLDGGRTRARGGLAATRLGGAQGDPLGRAEAQPPPSRLRHARGARGV